MALDPIIKRLMALEDFMDNKFDETWKKMEEKFATKEDLSRVESKVDYLVIEVSGLKNELLATNSWRGHVDEQAYDHENRLKSVEKDLIDLNNVQFN
jgi:hypothetical protein